MFERRTLLLRVLAVLALTASGPLLAESPPQELPIIQNNIGFGHDLTFGKRNCFPTTTREQAYQRRDDLIQLDREITVEEFLGAKIERIFILRASEPDVFQSPEEELRTWLHSIVVSPGVIGKPDLHAGWAEGVGIFLEGFIRYESGCTGTFRVAKSHFAAEDAHGVHWFHRWDAAFPKRQLELPEETSNHR